VIKAITARRIVVGVSLLFDAGFHACFYPGEYRTANPGLTGSRRVGQNKPKSNFVGRMARAGVLRQESAPRPRNLGKRVIENPY